MPTSEQQSEARVQWLLARECVVAVTSRGVSSFGLCVDSRLVLHYATVRVAMVQFIREGTIPMNRCSRRRMRSFVKVYMRRTFHWYCCLW
jgi:hypothetical protein